jgi:hypothetical protein
MRNGRLFVLARAQRFVLKLPLRYRAAGSDAWLKGTTVNISRSGVLFDVDEALAPQTTIEVELDLPEGPFGDAHLEASSIIVRNTDLEPGPRSTIAARFLRYRFTQRDRQ